MDEGKWAAEIEVEAVVAGKLYKLSYGLTEEGVSDNIPILSPDKAVTAADSKAFAGLVSEALDRAMNDLGRAMSDATKKPEER